MCPKIVRKVTVVVVTTARTDSRGTLAGMQEQILQSAARTMVPEGNTVPILNAFLAASICVLLAFGILAFGGVPESSIFILEAVAGALFLVWAAGRMVVPQAPLVHSPLLAPVLLFAGLVAVQLLPNRSAYWWATWDKALLWTSYVILFFLTTQCLGRERWLFWFGNALTTYGFGVALFAIVQSLAGNGKFFWVLANSSGGEFFGPYPNHAHYAGLMEMLTPFPLVLAMAALSPGAVRIMYAVVGVVMGSSIFLSRSRGGIFAFVVEIAVLTLLSGRGRRQRRPWHYLAVFCVLLVLCLILVPPAGLWDAVRQADQHDPGGRITMLVDCLRMAWHRPLLGWGFGTFSVVYPSFRSFYSDLIVNAAHDDFVETAAETGVAGFAVMVWFIYLLYRTGLQRIDRWRFRPRASVALAALVGCTGLLTHSLMDFNLQVPPNAALFFVLSAVATASVSEEVFAPEPRAARLRRRRSKGIVE